MAASTLYLSATHLPILSSSSHALAIPTSTYISTSRIRSLHPLQTQPTEMKAAQGLSSLQFNKDLWYKLHVLIYDLCNLATDLAAERRTLATTDELYISTPYFSSTEAIQIKTTKISPPILQEMPEFQGLQDGQETTVEKPLNGGCTSAHLVTVEEAIQSCLEKFFEKRRASGDARPCGPHDMAPIYLAVFGIAKAELRDENFLSRLRRSGLPKLEMAEEKQKDKGQPTKKRGNKGKRKS